MNSTNNEIYKIAKYLDKYTKESNKEGGVYLQKLDNYLHKVQRGGGDVHDLAKQIGLMVKEVIEKHQQAKSELQKSLGGVKGDSVDAKVSSLRSQISELEETIKQRKEQSARAASASPSPSPSPKAAASAPEVLTFETLSRENITTIAGTVLAQIICDLATDHVRELISDQTIIQLVSDVGTLQISQIITDIKQNFGSLTASSILKIIYTTNIFDNLPKDYKTTILIIEITIAILKIKEKILGKTRDEISELIKIVTGILRLSKEECKEIISKLFIEYVNSNESSKSIISHESFIEYYEDDWRYRISCTTKDNFPQEITAKEVCRRLDIEGKIKEEIITHPTQILTWNMYKFWTIVFVIYMFYNRLKPFDVVNEVFKDDNNAIVALKVAQQLMYMKFEAMEIREGKKVDDVEMRTVRGVSVIIDYLDKKKNDIAIFKEYVKDAYEKKVEYIHLDDFIKFKLQQLSSAPIASSPAAARASSSALATALAPVSPAPVRASRASSALASSAPIASASPALGSSASFASLRASPASSNPASASSNPASAAPASPAPASSVPQKDHSNPFSKKFDIVGFTITKESDISPYVIPDDQKEKVLEVLSPELKKKSKDVKLLSDQKKARIEFTEDLPIKDILNEINDRKDPQPTIFQTTGKKSGNPLNVWLFIVPVTYKIDENTDEPNKPYLEAINKLAEDELVKIASRMEGIKEGRQPVAQSPGGKAVVASTSQPYRTQQLSQYSSSGKSTTARQ